MKNEDRQFRFITGPGGKKAFDEALQKLHASYFEDLYADLEKRANELKYKHPRRKLK